MRNPTRLDTVSTEVSDAFWKASAETRRRAALYACEMAVQRGGVTDPEVGDALRVLRASNVAHTSALRDRLFEIAAGIDDRYFSLSETGGAEHEMLSLFSQARAVSAVSYALHDDSELLHEAIYEATASTDNPTEILQGVEAILKS